MFKHARIGHETQKSKQTYPRQADQRRAVQLPIQPVARALMLVERAHMRVDEAIGIHQDHLLVSPSANAERLGDVVDASDLQPAKRH